MTITPESKDWTWTITTACADCGFDGATFDPLTTAAVVAALAERWERALGPSASERPNPETWAPVEYACHVRDVFRLYEYRLGLMLDHDDPTFPNWDQDATAEQENYLGQDPIVVAQEVGEAGRSLAAAFAKVTDDQWTRTGNRSDNKHFTVASFATYMVHDPSHHLWDIGA